jgi:L-serine dehydratase
VFDYGPPLPGQANGLILRAYDERGNTYLTQTYYSVGGGFVVTAAELEAQKSGNLHAQKAAKGYPHPFGRAQEMLAMGQSTGLSIAAMKRANEVVHSGPGLDDRLDTLWQAMDACITRGLRMDGILPGGLKVKRRAKAIHEQLLAERGQNQSQPHVANDWLSVYAMAVNEENAAGGRVVTSPTNGAAGVVPSVVRYYRDHCIGANHAGIHTFLLTAAAIGGLIKHNASISGAEVGCQGEVGSAAAMAAAGLCAALGGTNEQWRTLPKSRWTFLGMTCDPIKASCRLHRAQRPWRHQGRRRRLAGAARRRRPCRAARRLHRDDAPDRTMSAKYKETSTGPRGQPTRVLAPGGIAATILTVATQPEPTTQGVRSVPIEKRP